MVCMIESNAFRAALSALGKPAILSFKVTYQIWEADPGYWRHCEFYLFAPSLEKAKMLAPKYCRDNSGQPIDYHNLEVSDSR